jgi:predicted Zn-dependent protease
MLPLVEIMKPRADQIGLTLMAIAGYNPEEAIAFWTRMAANSNREAPPEFLSTPSDASRIASLSNDSTG